LLMSADGKVKKTLPWGKNWAGWEGRIAWLDNQRLVLTYLAPTDQANVVEDEMLVLNPFTGSQRILTLTFPDVYDGPENHDPVHYSPSLTRVVYLTGVGDDTFKLLDIQQKKPLLVWTEFKGYEQNIPRWSPDGKKFIIYGILGELRVIPTDLHYTLYLVDNDGNSSELVSRHADFWIEDYFWSPSGRYLALLLRGTAPDGYSDDRLAILDLQTKEIVDECVEFRGMPYSDPPLIWSPDETQILLDDQYSEDHMRVILVDLAKGTAFPIAEDMAAVGWMKAP